MNVRYVVQLTPAERDDLQAVVTAGRGRVREVKRAQVLLASDTGLTDAQIAAAVGVSAATVYRLKRRCVMGGVEHALREAPRPGGARKLTGHEEALLIATACTTPPAGRARWTLQLLADELVRLTEHTTLGRETVRRRLAENELKPWQQKMWCVPKVDGEYVARMEDVLELYAAPPDPCRPVVCFDESPVQLIGEAYAPQPAAPGVPARVDYEYRRHGTANLFVMLDAHRGWRHVEVTDRRTALDFAQRMRDLVDVHYPDAACIRVVLDNLSTHHAGALYDVFAPAEARRILRRLEFHYTPKHASWLNMVEIEIGVLKAQCLDRRIADVATLQREVAAWEAVRNAAGAKIRWMFTVDRAREKLLRVYPQTHTVAGAAAA